MRKCTLIFLFVTALLACQRRPLYVMEQDTVKVVVKVLWKAEVYPEGIKPTGVTLYFFRDGEYYMSHTTADVDSCAVRLEPGRYRLYMISQSPEEYGKMEFDHMTDFQNASVSVVETKASWYTRGPGEETIDNPELMTAGVSDVFEVTEGNAERHEDAVSKAGTERVSYYTIRVPVYPRSIVSQYWVSIYSDNADVLRSVRASTSGMARTYELTRDVTGDEEGTQFITQWSLTMDDSERRVGHVDGKITTFGFPDGELPSVLRDSTLNVSALLVDDKTIEHYVFNVGNRITSETPPPGYRHLYRLVFGSVEAPEIHPPDVKPEGDASGFDATVEDWEEGETVEIPM